MRRQFDKIEFVNGDLCLWKGGVGRSYMCPFAIPNPCGQWCLHCGDVKLVEPIANGSVVLERADGMKYQLQLSCGSGITIEAKEHGVKNFKTCEVSQ